MEAKRRSHASEDGEVSAALRFHECGDSSCTSLLQEQFGAAHAEQEALCKRLAEGATLGKDDRGADEAKCGATDSAAAGDDGRLVEHLEDYFASPAFTTGPWYSCACVDPGNTDHALSVPLQQLVTSSRPPRALPSSS